jgi:hypothetical protein
MQLLLGFAQESPDPKDPVPSVWLTLGAEQQSEALLALARLLAKTATAEIAAVAATPEEGHDE